MISSTPTDLISSFYYGYRGSYAIEDTIEPGKGYWVKSDSAGKLILSSTSAMKRNRQPITEELSGFNTLTLTDNEGGSQMLYFGEMDNPGALSMYELPPPPPAGEFDARFSSQRHLEWYPSHLTAAVEYPIQLQWPVYPLKIAYKIKGTSHVDILLDEVRNGHSGQAHVLEGEGSISISMGGENSLVVKVMPANVVPKHFALSQNYPNPFNPLTVIVYQLPIESHVTLKIYNVLGQEVATLMEGILDAGFKRKEWAASNFPSGVYIYSLVANAIPSGRAGSFVATKKMFLIR